MSNKDCDHRRCGCQHRRGSCCCYRRRVRVRRCWYRCFRPPPLPPRGVGYYRSTVLLLLLGSSCLGPLVARFIFFALRTPFLSKHPLENFELQFFWPTPRKSQKLKSSNDRIPKTVRDCECRALTKPQPKSRYLAVPRCTVIHMDQGTTAQDYASHSITDSCLATPYAPLSVFHNARPCQALCPHLPVAPTRVACSSRSLACEREQRQ